MTSTTLKWNILQELQKRQLDPNSGHFRSKSEVEDCLIEPFKKSFADFQGTVNEYWVVLDEYRKDVETGYLIIYDEQKDLFGLATKASAADEKLGLLVSLYGSFIDTLNCM